MDDKAYSNASLQGAGFAPPVAPYTTTAPVKAPAKKSAKKKPAKKAHAKPHSGKVEITAFEVNGLPMGTAFKGHRPDLPKEVATRLVKEGVAKHV
jgi:hypothetical protein